MTARASVIVVPVGSVKGNPIFLDVEHPRYTGQVKAAGGNITSCHVSCGTFMKCLEFAIGRGVRPAAQASARGSARGKDQVIVLVRHHHLFVEVYHHAFVEERKVWG